MTSLKDTTEQLTKTLEDLLEKLRSELQNGEVDFEKLVSIADQISERADGLAETFTNINDALMQQIKDGASRSSRRQESRSETKSGSRS